MLCLQNAAANGLSEKISVVHRDAGLLERGKHVRRLGANIVVADMFDAGVSERQNSWLHPSTLLHVSTLNECWTAQNGHLLCVLRQLVQHAASKYDYHG